MEGFISGVQVVYLWLFGDGLLFYSSDGELCEGQKGVVAFLLRPEQCIVGRCCKLEQSWQTRAPLLHHNND